MEEATGRVERSEEEWEAIIEEQGKSKGSAAGFCKGQGIVYNHFLYHRSKILKKSGEALAMASSAGAASGGGRRGFIPIRVEGCSGIRLRFSGGLVLESDGIPSAAWVVEIARRWINGKERSC